MQESGKGEREQQAATAPRISRGKRRKQELGKIETGNLGHADISE
jgi:hypothetical protein